MTALDLPAPETSGGRTAAPAAPPPRELRLFDVDYTLVTLPDGGELFLTEFGRPLAPWLDPVRWHVNGKYTRSGCRQEGGTGTVYRVPITLQRRTIDIVVKVSRFAQDVPVGLETTLPHDLPQDLKDSACFASPFEEFGMINALRQSDEGPPDLRIATKRPLAIYCPAQVFPSWQLGRSTAMLQHHEVALRYDQCSRGQEATVTIHPLRDYLLLYGWVKGLDAFQCCEQGLVTERQIVDLTHLAAEDLRLKGYRVLDHKPRHLILRPRRRGGVLTRGGRTIYALIDFELLMHI